MSKKSPSNNQYFNLLVGLCLLVFFNISCFTVITSFTKSNFLTAIQISPFFGEIYNQKPYFFLYGFSGTCFVFFYLLYHSLVRKTTFEGRIKRDIQYLIGCSSILYLIPLFFPGFHRSFFPASVYFVIFDILTVISRTKKVIRAGRRKVKWFYRNCKACIQGYQIQ